VAFTLYYLGELVQAREHLERAIELYDPKRHHSQAFIYGQDPGVASLSYEARVLGYAASHTDCKIAIPQRYRGGNRKWRQRAGEFIPAS
jgi:hypothetical protein